MPESAAQQRLDLLVSNDLLASLDEWRRRQPDEPSRADAARRLLEQLLGPESGASITPAQLNSQNDV